MRLSVVSTYPPRRCGLATFTADLRAALATSVPHWQVDICAVDRDRLRYGPGVSQVLAQDDRDDYRRAARALASTGPDLVVIEHEYGIFGGPEGEYVLELADELRRLGQPYVVTVHTVLSEPDPLQRRVLAELCRHAHLVTCFTETAREVAARVGFADPARTVVVPHGVPVVLGQPADQARVGALLAETLSELAGRRVLSTFGLLRPGKGLETAIRAMPQVVQRHPDTCYLIAGATHPETVRSRGEEYRKDLAALADRLSVADRVWFVDAFLSEVELAALLQRTELYLTPYRTAQQTCSGALTFALAAGCPVVSTAYPYAVDLLAPSGGPPRGQLVPFDDPNAFAEAVLTLLDDPPGLAAARTAAAELGASLTWPAVGSRFAAALTGALSRRPGAGRLSATTGSRAAAPGTGTHRLAARRHPDTVASGASVEIGM